MAFSDTINTGTTPNDKQGDGLRTNLRKLIANDVFLKALITGEEEGIGGIINAPQEIYPNNNPSYPYWSVPTTGSETTLSEVVTFLNNKTITINSSKLSVIKVLGQKTINGSLTFIEKKYLFNKNNINGVWGNQYAGGPPIVGAIQSSDLIFINESVPTPNTSVNDVIIELGDILTNDIVTYLNNNPQPTSGQNWELQADTNYWFSYKSNGSDIVDFYRGQKPVVLGNQPSGNYDVLLSDFQRISTDGVIETEFDFDFTTQEITSGGNYNDLEVTGNLLVFTNENAQAILNGVWGKKEFHILNLSTQYEVQINHNSTSASGNGLPIKLPTNGGSVGVKGTARILYTDNYGYFVSDTWGSLYRPEFKGLTETKVVTVNEESNAGTRDIIELRVFRDAQSVDMSKADLNTAYPTALRGMEVICKQINKTYLKVDDNSNDWVSISNTNVV